VTPCIKATVPNLNVAVGGTGRFLRPDGDVCESGKKMDAEHLNYLVVGPWNHGGWAHGPGNCWTGFHLHGNTGEYFREKVEAPGLTYWLHDKGELPLKEALLFQTGSKHMDAFRCLASPRRANKSLYFASMGN